MDEKPKLTQWHQILGLTLADYFQGTCFEVEVEKDLAQKRQLLDILIIKRLWDKPPFPGRLCSGFDNLSDHNLITFKSRHGTMDDTAVLELLGHYLNYCKITGRESRITKGKDRLYAVTVRFPEGLARVFSLHFLGSGVYEFHVGSYPIRLIITNQIPQSEHDALWNLFSLSPETARYGLTHYSWKPENKTWVIERLYKRYQMEGLPMYTIENLKREILEDYTPEERVRNLSPEDRVKNLSPEDRMKALSVLMASFIAESPKDRIDPDPRALKTFLETLLSSEEIVRTLGADAILKAMTPEHTLTKQDREDRKQD